MITAETFRELEERLERWLWDLHERKGGWPAVEEDDEIGVWTSAEALRAFASLPTTSPERLQRTAEFVLGEKLPKGGWVLIRGHEVGCTVSTAEVLQALAPLSVRLRGLPIQDRVSEAIREGVRWLSFTQSRKDGGWGLEPGGGPEGQSRAFTTAYAVLGLTAVGGEEALALIRAGEEFLNMCHDPSGMWAGAPGGVPRSAITVLVAEALASVPGNDVVRQLPGLLDMAAVPSRDSLLRSVPVEEEEFQRGTGIVRLFCVGHYWAARAALQHLIPHPVLAGVARYLLTSKAPPYKLASLTTGQEWASTTWTTIEMLDLVHRFREALEVKPTLILESVIQTARQGGERRALPVLEPGSKAELGSALAEAILSGQFDHEDLRFASSLGATLSQVEPGIAEVFEKRGTSLLSMRVRSLESRQEAQDLLGGDAPIGSIARTASTAAVVLNALQAIAQGSWHEADALTESALIDREGGLVGATAVTTLRSLARSLSEVEAERGTPYLALVLYRALKLVDDLERQLGPIRSAPFLSGLFGDIGKALVREEQFLPDLPSLLPEVAAELRDGSSGKLTVRLRAVGASLKSVEVALLSLDSITILPSPLIAVPKGLGNYEAIFDVIPRTAGSVQLDFEVRYQTIGGRHARVTFSRQFDVLPSEDQVTIEFKPIQYRYEYGPVIEDPGRFVGRLSHLDEVALKLKTTNQAIAITGEWRIGKTSFLRAIEERMASEAGFGICPIDLQLVHPKTLLEFAEHLVQAMGNALKKGSLASAPGRGAAFVKGLQQAWASVETLRLPGGLAIGKTRPSDAIARAVSAFEYIDRELEQAKERVLATIDEINLLAEFDDPGGILSMLRGIIQRSNNVRFIVCAHDAFGSFRAYQVPFANVFQVVRLHGLTLPETRELVRLGHSEFTLADDAVRGLHERCGGNPYWMAAALDSVIRRLNAQRSRKAKLVDVEWGVREAIEAQGEIFRRAWEDAISEDGDVARSILVAFAEEGGHAELPSLLARTSGVASLDRLRTTLDRLIEKGFLRREGNTVAVANPLFDRWIELRYGTEN